MYVLKLKSQGVDEKLKIYTEIEKGETATHMFE